MKVTNNFVLFWRDYLGNWTKPQKPIEYSDRHWQGPIAPDVKVIIWPQRQFQTSEHMFMYLKAVHFKDWETAEKIVKAASPKEAKDLGREVKNFDEAEWEKVRENAMFTTVYYRSQYDRPFLDRVMKSEWSNLEFVEASPYDKIWGIGLSEDNPDADDKSKWPGLNLLGKCITELRRYNNFMNYLNTWEEHAFFEEMIWCPSQIEYYFTDPTDNQMYVVYSRWRHDDPWTTELVMVADRNNPQDWNFDLESETILRNKFYKDLDYPEMEKDIIEYLKVRFPSVQFPSEIKTKNHDNWDGPKFI